MSSLNLTDFTALTINDSEMRQTLDAAPDESAFNFSISTESLTLVNPDGHPQRFKICETAVMAPELAAQFPDIKTYAGQGIDDPTATVHLDLTPQGFHAQVLSAQGRWYIDPYFHLNDDFYASYYARDSVVTAEHRGALGEDVETHLDDIVQMTAEKPILASAAMTTAERSGAQLRTYRTAVAATGEYTAFHGGTVGAGQAAIVTAINRISGIYETELAIRLQLVANNSSLVFTDASADPYSNTSPSQLLTQNQLATDSIIGTANYDVGHVFSTGGGGLAGLGVVGITGQKARGETGTPSPAGDAFFVDYVAHEMAHQFGANHTYNTSTDVQRHALTAYEPGSGSTIMGYAGITGDDLQAHSDAYFHSASFDEIIAFVDNTIPTVGVRTTTGNSVPTVSAGLDYSIPTNTPFTLLASGADTDTSDVLTYGWEQRDLGPAQRLSSPDNGTSPLFRSFTPTTNRSRTFPNLPSILSNTSSVGDKLPTLPRTMDFRVTVRDNHPGGGGVNTDDTVVNVVDTGAAFALTSQNSAATLAGGSSQTVTWNVAGTTANGINTSDVRILLSIDGGNTFSIILANSTPNDGSQTIMLPNTGTSQARIKVEAVGNIFFDINDANFTITGPVNAVPAIGGAVANQPVNDTATLAPFSTMTITDPDTNAMSAIVRINNGLVRGDFTPGSAAGWTRSVSGNNIQYTRAFPATANVGSVVQAAVRAFVFDPRENAIKPNTTETTTFNVTVTDGIANPVTNTATSLITMSVNNAPAISGANPSVAVNDNSTVNPFGSLVVSDADFQEGLAKITIFNGAFRGDFTNAQSSGWTRSTTGNNINYVRYFSPTSGVGTTVQAAFRALVFQPRQNAIRPETTELTDFLVSMSDGVASPAVDQNTRVTTTSINNAPMIAGAVAGQTMNDGQKKAVFSTLTITDLDTQDMFVRVTIVGGAKQGDFIAGSTAGWTRSVSNGETRYERYFSLASNIAAIAQAAVRALIFQPRNDVPNGLTETTNFSVFVNDGLKSITNSATSVITTGVAPRLSSGAQARFQTSVDDELNTVKVPALFKTMSNPLVRLLQKTRRSQSGLVQ